jgi:hypothetical protein
MPYRFAFLEVPMNHVPVEFHLLPAAWPVAVSPAAPQPVRLPFSPARLHLSADAPQLLEIPAEPHGPSVHVQPFFNQHHQPRLLATFAVAAPVYVNGEPAAHTVVLRDRDVVHASPAPAFRVMVFKRPQLGPPPAAKLGKRCPVCSVPFQETAACYTCFCGVVFHCEADPHEGLQCAQLRRECPGCKRPVDLSEGYLSPVSHED